MTVCYKNGLVTKMKKNYPIYGVMSHRDYMLRKPIALVYLEYWI